VVSSDFKSSAFLPNSASSLAALWRAFTFCHSVLYWGLWSQYPNFSLWHLNFLAPAPEQFGPKNKKKICIICITRFFHNLYLWNRNPNFRLLSQPFKFTWAPASIALVMFSSLRNWEFTEVVTSPVATWGFGGLRPPTEAPAPELKYETL